MALKDIQSTGNKDTRSGFGDGIVEAARKNPNIVALTADLAGSLKLNQFMKEFPERFIQLEAKFLTPPLLPTSPLVVFMTRSVNQLLIAIKM